MLAGGPSARARIPTSRPTRRRRDSHGGRSGECPSRACIVHRDQAADATINNPATRQEARGADASCKSLRAHGAHPTHNGQATGGSYASRKEATLLSIRGPYPKPPMALPRRSRSCMGASVLPVRPSSYRVVHWPAAWCQH